MKFFKKLIISLAFANSFFVQAGIISKIEVNETQLEINKEFTLTLKFADNPNPIACGVVIDWGDGKIERFRVGEGQQIPPPYNINHIYTAPENYKLRIVGEALIRGLRSVPACEVKREGVISVVDPVVVARIAQEKAEVERQRREKQEIDAARLANQRAEAEAARARKRDQLNAVLNNSKSSLDDKLSGACVISFPDAKEYAAMTNNAPMDTCDEFTLQTRIKQEYAIIVVTKYTGNGRYSIINIPSRRMPSDGITTNSVTYSVKGDLMISDLKGCILTDKIEVDFDTLKKTSINMTGNCAAGQKMAHESLKKLGPTIQKLLRPNMQ